jgi:HEAT repeat protein
MEELRPEDIEELLQELEGASSTQESHPPDVEELLHVLQSGSLGLARRDAAEQLGNVGTIGPRIARALMTACESDPDLEVRRAAAQLLRGPVHPVYLGQRPDLM